MSDTEKIISEIKFWALVILGTIFVAAGGLAFLLGHFLYTPFVLALGMFIQAAIERWASREEVSSR